MEVIFIVHLTKKKCINNYLSGSLNIIQLHYLTKSLWDALLNVFHKAS